MRPMRALRIQPQAAIAIVLGAAALLLAYLFLQNPLYLMLLVGAEAGVALLLWMNAASKKALLAFIMEAMLWLGFLHSPFTPGNYVFWLQELILLLCLAVIALRGTWGARLKLSYVLVPLGIIGLTALYVTLRNESIYVYLNGLRRIFLAPLMFILGQKLAFEDSGKAALRILQWTFLLQFPACLILIFWHTGSFFGATGADLLTGTFGRGGTGYIVIFMPAVLGIFLWMFAKRKFSLKNLLIMSGILLLLGRWSDLKYLYVLLPMVIAVAFLLLMRQQPSRRKWKTVTIGIVGAAVLLVILGLVISASSVRFHSGTLTVSSMFNPEWLDDALSISSGGIIRKKSEEPMFSRYGVLLYLLEFLPRDWETLLAGRGLGSTAYEGALGPTKLGQEIGIGGLDFSALSVLLFETGLGGTILYLAPFFLLTVSAFFLLRKKRIWDPEDELLSGIVALYGFCLLASLPYNGFALTLRGGGIFWLLAGLWYASRKRSFSQRSGAGAASSNPLIPKTPLESA